jgi:hypothetical protein
LAGTSALGALIAAIIASFLVVAAGQRDRRLRQRDEIADSIGVPVLASMSVQPPLDAAAWSSLLQRYLPGSVDAWRLRKALQYLGCRDLDLHERPHGGALSLTVISLSFDARALALGPQLAAFAASRGIPTALVVGPQQDVNATATLRAACAQPLPSTPLRLMVSDDQGALRQSGTVLRVVVTVVKAEAPQVRAYEAPEWSDVIADTAGSAATVIAVSAGAATAEQLARVAASAAVRGHDIIGILVADPDPADPTTGRLPQVSRPARARRPRRITGTAAEANE